MKKQGITLLNLVITIVVVIILAGVVIFSLTQSDPAEKAVEAVFKNDVANLKEDLRMYHYQKTLDEMGNYASSKLNADKTMVEYSGKTDNEITMLDVIKTMNKKISYADKFEVYEGELVYIGADKKEKEWAEEIGIKSKYAEPKIDITSPSIE